MTILASPSQAIGIFDSGIGGLTIAKAIKKELPKEHIVYFGDTIHLPYGDKTGESIKYFAEKIVDFLLQNNCKIIVIACNSASAVATKLLEQTYKNKIAIINVIDPTIDYVLKLDAVKKVGLIGTKRTVGSGVYARKFKKRCPEVSLYSKATPLLAPMIEEGFFDNNISKTVIHSYLANHHLQNIDTLILGCTHYPLINKEIQAYYNGKVRVVDSSVVTALKVKASLQKSNLLLKEKSKEGDHFYVSEYTPSFARASKLFFSKQIKLEEVKLFNQ